jgi:hypothetical protein
MSDLEYQGSQAPGRVRNDVRLMSDPEKSKMTDPHEAETLLAAIVGLPVWGVARASDMAMLSIGGRVSAPGPRGLTEKGEYALHVQCPWRATHAESIIVGAADWWRDELAPSAETALTRWQDLASEGVIERVSLGKAGSISLELTARLRFEVFPNKTAAVDGRPIEHWRFFRPTLEDNHLVFTSGGYSLD